MTKVCRWLSGGSSPCTTFSFDIFGNQTVVTDANNHSSTVFFDSTYHAFPETLTNALNQITTNTYDGLGRLQTVTDPNNLTTTFQYDPLNRTVAEIVAPDTASFPTVSYTYLRDGSAPEGSLVKRREETGQGGTIDSYTFVDGLGRTIQTKNEAPDGVSQTVIDTTYNNRGLVETVSIPYLVATTTGYTTPNTGVKKTTTLYDPVRRVSQITHTDGTLSTRDYDRWTTTLIDQNGNQKKETRDAFGRLAKVEEYTGTGGSYSLYAVTTYQYDTLGNLKKTTDALGNEATMTYDTLGRKTSMHDPDMGDWSYEYDPVGNLLQQTDAKGQVIDFTYDELNRVLTKTTTGGGGQLKLVITSPEQSVPAGSVSSQVTFEVQDASNNLVSSYNGSANLDSDSQTMRFDTSPTGPFDGSITSVSISNGTGSFYFTDTVTGTPNITVSSGSLTSGNQAETITSSSATLIEIISAPQSIPVNTVSEQVNFEIRDEFNNAVTTASGTATLSTDSATLQFSTDGVNFGEISVGYSNGMGSFYFKDTAAGSPIIVVSDMGLISGEQQQTITTAPTGSKLTSISTRAFVGTGTNVEIGGFIIEGSDPKTVLIRARGPSMSGAPFNISGTLSNPFLKVYSFGSGTYIAQNDNWQTSDPLCANSGYSCGTPADITATGMDPCQPNPGQSTAPPGCTQESAVLITLPPGQYGAIVNGVNNGTGVGLVEVFEVDTSASILESISTRAFVGTGANVEIGGFIIEGSDPKTVLIRARGPSMSGAPFNISGTLSNPFLKVYSFGSGTYIAQNDNWQTSDPLCANSGYSCGTPADITATGMDPCQPNPGQSTAPPGCANESAVLITLPPGQYGAIVSGVNNGTGVGLVEVFSIP